MEGEKGHIKAPQGNGQGNRIALSNVFCNMNTFLFKYVVSDIGYLLLYAIYFLLLLFNILGLCLIFLGFV